MEKSTKKKYFDNVWLDLKYFIAQPLNSLYQCV